jgi:hypothetical protein
MRDRRRHQPASPAAIRVAQSTFRALAFALAIALVAAGHPSPTRAGGGRVPTSDGSTAVARPSSLGTPSIRIVPGGLVGEARVSLRVSWPAPDGGSTMLLYELLQRVDGGDAIPVSLLAPSTRSVDLAVRPGHTYRFVLWAIDATGRASHSPESLAIRPRLVTQQASGVHLSPSWTTIAQAGSLGGQVVRSTTPGATARFEFVGSGVGWVAPRGSGLGAAEVLVDDVPVASVDLGAADGSDRHVVFSHAFARPGYHRLEIRVAGASELPAVDIDGFVVLGEEPADPVLVGAGDIASCGQTDDDATAALLDRIGGTVFTAGDNAYDTGTAEQFATCYGQTWGRHRSRTYPVPGNHDYMTPDAAPYFAYFGARAGDPGAGWYAYDLGTWRIYALNSDCDEVGGCGADSPQWAWLQADLAAHPHACSAAIWHHPLFSSGEHGSDPRMAEIWTLLDTAGVELVINGHEHDYERFAPQHASGTADPRGMREIVVGTGGAGLRPFHAIAPNSEVRDDSSHGVLKLTLRQGGYDWTFIPVTGDDFTDSGSDVCR